MGVVGGDNVKDVLLALCTGALVGLVFGLVRLPPPAPQTWAGVAGIVGIVAAWMLVARYVR